jgi:alpha-beta hydrolase superfamily lysophospholipase
MPTLIVQGSADTIAPPERVRALKGGNVDVEMFDGQLHSLFHDARAADVARRVIDWLEAKLPR